MSTFDTLELTPKPPATGFDEKPAETQKGLFQLVPTLQRGNAVATLQRRVFPTSGTPERPRPAPTLERGNETNGLTVGRSALRRMVCETFGAMPVGYCALLAVAPRQRPYKPSLHASAARP